MSKKKTSYNPFAMFRKNQVVFLAGLGFMAMIAFIILPAFIQLIPGLRGNGGNGDFARTRHHGKVDEQLLANLRKNREQLARFYSRLAQVVLTTNPSLLSSQEQLMRLQLLIFRAGNLEQRISDEELINLWLIARYSEDQGIKVGTDAVINILNVYTNNLLTKQNLDQVMEELGLDEQYIEYLIAEEIRQNQMSYMFSLTQRTVLPSTKWDWFKRLNRQVTLEVATLPVSAFIDKVPDPTDSQIKKFFEENKDREYDPTRPETGFSFPKQIAFSYIKATPSKKLLDSISQEDIKNYYESNKDQLFRKPINNPINRQNTQQPNVIEFNYDTLDKKRINTTTENNKTTNETKPEIKEEEKKNETKTETEPNKTPNNTEPEKQKEIQNNSTKNNLLNSEQINLKNENETLPKIKLVSYQNEPTESKPTESTPPNAKPEEAKPAETKPVDVKSEEVKPAEAKPVDAKSDEVKPAETKPVEAAPIDLKPAGEVDLSILYRPLSEVESDIRHFLAQIQIDKALEVVESRLRSHYEVYKKYVDRRLEDPKLQIEPPAVPDLSEYLSPYGLEVVSEELGSLFDVMRRSEFVRGEDEREFIIQWFKRRPYEYQTNKINIRVNGRDSKVLIWATDFISNITPKNIDEIASLAEMVKQRWKEVQARELALKFANELADSAKSSSGTLEDVLKSKSDLLTFVETEPFTWMTYGYSTSDQFLRVSEVREKGVRYGEAEFDNKSIHAPGENFMQAASNLEIGEVAAVFNQPQTTVHIIKAKNLSPSEDELWEKFKTTPPQTYFQAGEQERFFEAREAWLENIKAEMYFQWINKPKLSSENDAD
ncbi:MAG: hypothetical protein LBQ66_12165 [Planctomycetaceae bacterium]|jgi:hypothetical protein|nr:hypothetical protein [Planctomycetaceae bacterium]